MWQRPLKSLHQAPDSATRGLSPFTAFSEPDKKSRHSQCSVLSARARLLALASRCDLQIASRLSESRRSTRGAARSIAAGVWGDGTPPMEGAMVGDGIGVGRYVRMGVGSDGRPIEGAMEGHRGTLSMCFRRFDAGPVSTLTILLAVNNRSMAARKASADTPLASGSPANSNGALPRPVLGRTGRPWAMRLSSSLRKSSSTSRSAAAR